MNKLSHSVLFFFEILLFLHFTSKGYNITNYSVDQGLGASHVYSIHQCDKGYIWFGTYHGISKFDGRDWFHYSSKDSLSIGWVINLFEDSRGRIWSLPLWGKISYFQNDKWSHYEPETIILTSHCDWTKDILEDSKGNIWIASKSKGIARYDNQKWTRFNTKDGLINDSITTLTRDKQDYIWAGTVSGLCRFNGKEWSDFRFSRNAPQCHITSIFSTTDNVVWIGTLGNGVYAYKNKRFYHYKTTQGLISDSVFSITRDSRGKVWFVSLNGLSEFDGETWSVYKSPPSKFNPYSQIIFESRNGKIFLGSSNGLYEVENTFLKKIKSKNKELNNNITSISEDVEGNIWIGNNNGVSKLTETNINKVQIGQEDFNYETRALYEDKRGNIWVGTKHYGLFKLEKEKWKHVIELEKKREGWINDIIEDAQGNTRIATSAGGICHNENGKWESITVKDGLAENWVNALLLDKNDNWWYGHDTFGLSKYDGEKWTRFDSAFFKDNSIHHIIEDSQGVLWFASYDKGVARFDGVGWKIFTKKDGLCGNRVTYIYEDKEKNIWFATHGDGICKYDGTNWWTLDTSDGLSNNDCWFITQAGEYYFIGTGNGLNRYDGKSIKVYRRKDGLPSSEMSPYGCLKDQKGNIWLGTLNGLAIMDPSKIKTNSIPPPLHMTSIKCKNKEIPIKDTIRLDYSDNNLKFEFIGICLTSPEEVVYKYKLESLEKKWNFSKTPVATYSYLPPGEHRFIMTAANNDGRWNPNPLSLQIFILPPFYSTLWFKLCVIVIILFILASIYKYKTYRLNKRSLELEETVEQRTKELTRYKENLEEAYTELEAINNQLRTKTNELDSELEKKIAAEKELRKHKLHLEEIVKERTEEIKKKDYQLSQAQKMESIGTLAGGIAHDFNNVLGGIIGSLSTLKYKLKKKDKLDKKEIVSHLQIIQKSADHATDLVQQILSISRKREMRTETMDLNHALEHVFKICENTFDKRIQFKVKYHSKEAIIKGDTSRVEQVLLNICINAFHALTIMRKDDKPNEGTISLEINKIYADEQFIKKQAEVAPGNYWVISISDNGVGMDEMTVSKIFDPFFSTKRKEEGTGLGLSMAYNIMKQHHGFINVYSALGQGTTFKLYFPRHALKKEEKIPEKEADIPKGEGLILLAEDDAGIRATSQAMLNICGYDVIAAKDGQEAVDLFHKHKDELTCVIIDTIMPKKSGPEVLMEIKKAKPEMKSILSSGFKRDKRLDDLPPIRSVVFLEKPYSIKKLASILHSIIKPKD